MILKGSERGGARNLALHLLNTEDNDHVEVHSIKGFIAQDVEGAFQEIEVVSRATKCRNFLFSLSLSPPEGAVVSNADFENATESAMTRLGLGGQPHVVIFHEKNGRRHCHLVVSRIDGTTLKGINLPFFKERLCQLSYELYLAHGWDVPKGHEDRTQSDPLNYSLEEHQVAKHAKRDPRGVKALLQSCWAGSDSAASFSAALKDAGFTLCRGDRRGFVAINGGGAVYSLSRWLGVKSKDLAARLGDPLALPSVDEALLAYGSGSQPAETDPRIADRLAAIDVEIETLLVKKTRVVQVQRRERAELRNDHERAGQDLHRSFAAYQRSLRGLWDGVMGRRSAIIAERRAALVKLADQHADEALSLSDDHRQNIRALRREVSRLRDLKRVLGCSDERPGPEHPLVLPADVDRVAADQIRKHPDRILEVLSDKRVSFTRGDIARGLSTFVTDPASLTRALQTAMASPELVLLDEPEAKEPRYTTRAFQHCEARLHGTAQSMAKCPSFGVEPRHFDAAVAAQNERLRKTVGAELSREQRGAIQHVLNRRQLCAVVGLAGSGKSTMLAAVHHAFQRQGYRVMGAALSGKAADGLQSASNIPSRTLAAWEMSWRNNKNQLQPGDVFVIDEAGMIGTKQMEYFVTECRKRRAKLVLVGDPAQLTPINAGTPFADLLEQVGSAKLSNIRRQNADWQRQATRDLAEGRIAEALAAYQERDAIEFAPTQSDAITALVEEYMTDLELRGPEVSRLALAHRRHDVHAINQGIRAARKSAGEVTDEIVFTTDHGPRGVAAGDRLLFTKNDRDLGVRNGTTGTVEKVGSEQIIVRIDGNDARTTRQVSVSPRRFSAFDHAYATSIHKSQGATVDHAFVLASRSMDRHLAYVALSRHRNDVMLFASRDQFTSDKALARGLGREAGERAHRKKTRLALDATFSGAARPLDRAKPQGDPAPSHTSSLSTYETEFEHGH